MPELLFPLDSAKKFTDQAIVGHNRWHPDIPAAVTVKPGDAFRVHCREWFDGAIHNDDSADDHNDRADNHHDNADHDHNNSDDHNHHHDDNDDNDDHNDH